MKQYPIEQRLTPTGYWRNIVRPKHSVMINNDERVLYSNQKMEVKADAPARLVLSRPVFEIELRNGLQPVAKSFDLLGNPEHAPELTLMLDAFFKLKQNLEFYKQLNDFRKDKKPWNEAQALATIVGTNYYDCLSGGWDAYSIWAVHQLSVGLDLSVHAYPKDKGWYTLQNFLKDTAETVKSKAIEDTARQLTCPNSPTMEF